MALGVKIICNGMSMGVWFLVSWQRLGVFFERFISVSE